MTHQWRVQNWLSREERKLLLAKSDALAWLEILKTWGWIAAAFALVYFWPNAWTVLVAAFLIGGKQLGCAIIMHDASHRALFRSASLNDWVGRLLGAWPIFNDLDRYRPYHYTHHVHTGYEEDPDLLLTRGYPTSRRSMMRKVLRDLSGITGAKAFIGLLAMHLGFLEYNLGNKLVRSRPNGVGELLRNAVQNLGGPLLVQLALFGTFWLIGNPWLYLLWIGSYLTTFQFCLRVRSMAEHSMVPDAHDTYRNTRTMIPGNWVEQMLFAPHYVNYHVEHHMLMAVPPYRLPRMHKLLMQNGFYEKGGLLVKGYSNILKMAMK